MPHFYSADEAPVYSSRSSLKLDQRRLAIHELVFNWRAVCEQPFVLDIERKSFVSAEAEPIKLDIYILVNGKNHLLEDMFIEKNGIKLVTVKTENPLMIPFASYHVFFKNKGDYDWFVYSEDDLVLRDPFIFQKQALFRRHFGEARLLQPNRFEFNPDGPSIKTYVDGNLREGFIKPFLDRVDEREDHLSFDYGNHIIVLT